MVAIGDPFQDGTSELSAEKSARIFAIFNNFTPRSGNWRVAENQFAPQADLNGFDFVEIDDLFVYLFVRMCGL
jgi:hypothetical protein